MIPAHGRANLKLLRRGTSVEVESREAVIRTPSRSETLSAGQRLMLGVDGAMSIEGRGLDYADVELLAGKSVVVHDPKPPTAVRFTFGEVCSGPGRVELSRVGKIREYAVGSAAVALALGTGAHRYELTCASASAVTRRGTITVSHDQGTRGMASHAPSTTLQADGRHYTILYQNRLPAIQLTWPDPPKAGVSGLVHEVNGRSETLELDGPSYAFQAGALPEGLHAFHFEGGGKVSRHTRVAIAFDNAAPTATLSTPATLAAEPGELVEVAGIALPGWDVNVEGQSPTRDAQGRFSVVARLPTERRALSVWLEHPKRGTHVYLRRAQGRP
jgi:hypothetical protein